MKVYIEVVVILILLFIFLSWKLWETFSQKRLAKKYKPQNDKSRKGGTIDDWTAGTEEQGITPEPPSFVGPEQPERRELFPETTVSDVGEDSSLPRKDSSGVRKFFRRTRKN